jgi:predicted CoA-binding protein
LQASQSEGPGTGDWRDNIVDDDRRIGEILATTQRIAVLGIKPEDRAHKPAHYVPKYLHDAGFEIVPVPVYYPDCTHILGQSCYRSLAAVPGSLDMVVVFRRSEHVPPHVDDIIAKKPRVAWFQSGIRNDEAAAKLAQAGILVVQDRCMMVEHRRRR